jgi:hypothetical protein
MTYCTPDVYSVMFLPSTQYAPSEGETVKQLRRIDRMRIVPLDEHLEAQAREAEHIAGLRRVIEEMNRGKNPMDTCDGCAFNSNTTANKSDLTRLKAQLCVESRDPFYCHEAIERITNQGFTQDEAFDIARQDGELHLCAGYVESVKMLTDAGFYDRQPEWQKDLKRTLADVIVSAESGATEEECFEMIRLAVEQ